jgi:ParB family chromosome partitioning protein
MKLELGELDLRYAELRIREVSRQRRLVASLAEHGQQTPVLVVRDGDAWVLIDGYARVAALRKLAEDLVEVAVLEVSEAEALVMGYRLDNGRQRSALEEGWMLRELVERHTVERRELSQRLDRSTSWVSRRLALVSALPEVVQEKVRTGKLSVQAATKYLVPLARANTEDCVRLVEQLDGERVSVRQMERLYVAWKGGDQELRARIVDEPRLYLRAEESARAQRAPEDDEQAAILKDLSIVASVCLRVCRRLVEGEEPISQSGRDARRRAWSRAKRAQRTLQSHFEPEEKTDARPRHPNRDLAPQQRRTRDTKDLAAPESLAGGGPQGTA